MTGKSSLRLLTHDNGIIRSSSWKTYGETGELTTGLWNSANHSTIEGSNPNTDAWFAANRVPQVKISLEAELRYDDYYPLDRNFAFPDRLGRDNRLLTLQIFVTQPQLYRKKLKNCKVTCLSLKYILENPRDCAARGC